MTSEIYLDGASATPARPEAARAMAEAVEAFGDPIRPHAAGRQARDLLEEARLTVAEALSAQPDEIVFTSGGTESVALAIRGSVSLAAPGGRVVVSAVEHPCVEASANRIGQEPLRVVRVPVDATGRLDPDAFLAEIRKPGTVLASVQHANHEVGTLQPVAEAARLAREAGVRIHTDACQSVGRLPIDVGALDVDLLSLSGHKFGGPPGIGALYVRRGVPLAGYPGGDDRERHRRAGMENLPGAVGLAAALRAAQDEMRDTAALHWEMTDRLRRGLEERVPTLTVHGHPTQRAPHLVGFSVSGLDPEVLLMALDDRGFRVGGGAVSSGLAHAPSPVLAAMGVPDAHSVRVGLTHLTTDQDISRFLDEVPGLMSELHRVEEVSSHTLSRIRRRPGD